MTLTMVVGKSSSFVVSNSTSGTGATAVAEYLGDIVEMFQCWKENAKANTAALKAMRCAVL